MSTPDVHSLLLTEEDEFLILACDGVWDVLSNQQAVSYVHRRLLTHRDVQRAAIELIDKVLASPIAVNGNGYAVFVSRLHDSTKWQCETTSLVRITFPQKKIPNRLSKFDFRGVDGSRSSMS